LRAVSANLAFLIVRDRDGLFQVVIEDPEEIKKLD
jgi:aspartyl/asparaginyl-tRNA synthetase